MSDLIIIGGGGHAKVVADIATLNGYKIRGFLDDNTDVEKILNYNRLGNVSDCIKYGDCSFVIAIGNNLVRRNIFEKYSNFEYVTLIHPSVCIGSGVEIGEGTVIMPGAVVNACTKIGKCCVINSGAVVEHDCTIGDFTLIAPNSTVCGVTSIGSNCWLGAGCTVNNVLGICDNVTLGSGAVVVSDITTAGTYVGVPAKMLKNKGSEIE